MIRPTNPAYVSANPPSVFAMNVSLTVRFALFAQLGVAAAAWAVPPDQPPLGLPVTTPNFDYSDGNADVVFWACADNPGGYDCDNGRAPLDQIVMPTDVYGQAGARATCRTSTGIRQTAQNSISILPSCYSNPSLKSHVPSTFTTMAS